jgi:hypothetical protein
MPDDTTKRGEPDPSLINTNQLHEVRCWAKRLKCTERELLLAAWNARPFNTVEMVRAQLELADQRLKHLRILRGSAKPVKRRLTRKRA